MTPVLPPGLAKAPLEWDDGSPPMKPTSPEDTGHRSEHEFLMHAAGHLNAYGTPAHRLERVLGKLAESLGVEAKFFSTPTSVMASFGSGGDERVHLARTEPGEVNLGKLVEFDEVLEAVEHGQLDVQTGIERLDQVAESGPRYGAKLVCLAFAVASAGAARLFGGGWAEMIGSALLGAFVYLTCRALGQRADSAGTVEPIAAFMAALAAMLLARFALAMDAHLVTLAALIVLLPGLTLTVGMIELSTRHLVAGTARLARAGVVFLTILFGVGLAWKLLEVLMPGALYVPEIKPLAPWTAALAVLPLPIAFAILFDARPSESPVIFAASTTGYLASELGASYLSLDIAPFVGALVVGLVGNFYARTADRPALVAITPGILVLVPGSIGFRSLTSFLESGVVEGMDGAFRTGFVAISLVCGLLASNLVLPPRRIL